MITDFIFCKSIMVGLLLLFALLSFVIKGGLFKIISLFFAIIAIVIFFSYSEKIILVNQVSPEIWLSCDNEFYKENPPEKFDGNTLYSYRDSKCTGWSLNPFAKWEYILNDPYDPRIAEIYTVSAESENKIATAEGKILSLYNPIRETIYMSSDRVWKERNGNKIQSILVRCIVPADNHFRLKIQTIIFT